MLPLLAFPLILCLVSMSGEGWAKILSPKIRNNLVVTIFQSAILPMVSCLLSKKWEAGVWNQGIFRIVFCILSILYVEIILEATIYRVIHTQLYYMVSQLVKYLLSLDVTAVFLVYTDKRVCRNIVIETRKRSGSNIKSNQGDTGDKIRILISDWYQ